MTILLKASAIVPALLLGNIIDSLASSEGINARNALGLLAVLCFTIFLQSIFNPLQTYQLVRLVQSTLKEKSIQWTAIILGKEFEQFSSLKIGGLIKSVERGITAHEKLLTFFVTSGFPLVIELILTGLVFVSVGGGEIFLGLLAVSVGYLMVYRHLINWRRPCLQAVNLQEDTVASRLFEILQAGKLIKLEQACQHAVRPLCRSYEDYAEAATRVASSGAILGSVRILYLGFTTAGLLAWGVYDQLSGSPRLTVGDLVAVFSISGMLLNNFSHLAEAYRMLDQFQVDKHRLQQILSLDNLTDSIQIPALRRVASLTLSTFNPISDRVLNFIPTQSVAIIGTSGAGKTTLLEIMAGILKTQRKYLSANGEKVDFSNLNAYLNRVRYCPQNPVFLEGFFRQSVLFGHDEAAFLADAISALELQELVGNRPISEGAKDISGGEAKRLSLLRLINRPGDFNLFDEPTASLDQETRRRVWNVMFCYFQNKGLICVTHDLAVLPRFDRVIVMSGGRIIADGHWCELEAQDGIADIATQIARPATPDA